MKYYENLKIEEFNEFSKNHYLNSIFQNSSWANTKSNWKSLYVGVKENDEIIAGGLVLLRRLPMNFNFAYMPRGPLLDFNDEKLVSFFFENLKKHLRKEKVLLCKLDPNLIISEIDFDRKDEISSIKDDVLINKLKKVGLNHTGYTLLIKDSIQPRIQLELKTENYDTIIPSKTMKKVRSSEKKGVVIVNEKHNVDSLSKMIDFTKNRHNINLRNKEYFSNLIKSFKDDACVMSGYVDETLISSCLLVKSKDTTEILYSGYDDDYKKYYSTYLLRYKCIQWAKEQGCKYFSFGGVEGTLDDGLTMFKSSFNPSIRIYIGEFDLLPIPALSKLISLVYPHLKSLKIQ